MSTSDANYFKWDNYIDVLGINLCINFANQLIEKYKKNWKRGTYQNLRKQLESIEQKQKDNHLNISVIGDFSSGKSTFINALLRCELLEEDFMQATTAAATILEYGSKYEIKIEYKNGKNDLYSYSNIEAIRNNISKYTASDYAQDIDTVRICLPAPILNSGIRIIDTPGTDSTKEWHSDVTVRTLRDVSDMSVIIVDATKILPDTLCQFIKDHLFDILPRCVFLLNKFDRIRPKERKRTVKYVSTKLKSDFSLDNGVVLPFTALGVREAFVDNAEESLKESELIKLSLESEKRLIAFAAEQRGIVQAKKLLALMSTIYGDLSTCIAKIDQDLQAELRVLEASRDTDFSVFIAEQKIERKANIRRRIQILCDDLDSDMRQQKSDSIRAIESSIDYCDYPESLKSYFDDNFTSKYADEARKIINKIIGIEAIFRKYFSEEIKAFQDAFSKKFIDLNLLSIQFKPTNSFNFNLDTVVSINIDEVKEYVKNKVIGAIGSTVYGGTLGATVGTIICPGIGTFIGGLIGGAAGRAAAVSGLDEVKGKVKSKVTPALSGYFDDVIDGCHASLNKCTNDVSRCIENEIDTYHKTYKAYIESKIRDWNTKRNGIVQQISAIEQDKMTLNSNKSKLHAISDKLQHQQIQAITLDIKDSDDTTDDNGAVIVPIIPPVSKKAVSKTVKKADLAIVAPAIHFTDEKVIPKIVKKDAQAIVAPVVTSPDKEATHKIVKKNEQAAIAPVVSPVDKKAVSKVVNKKDTTCIMPGEASFMKAEKLRTDKKYSEAFNIYMDVAKQGHPGASYWLGWCFNYGFGVKRSLSEARKHYEQAVTQATKYAEKGVPGAQYILGQCYELGVGVNKKDLAKAAELYQKAAAQGYTDAINIIKKKEQVAATSAISSTDNKFVSKIVKKNEQVAIAPAVSSVDKKAISKIVKKKDAPCIMPGEASFMKAEKLRTDKKYSEAFNIYMDVAKQGHPGASYWLGWCFNYGFGVKRSLSEARKHYEQAVTQATKYAEKGVPGAQYILGQCYELGVGVNKKDLAKAAELYQKAAAQGYADAVAASSVLSYKNFK